MLKTQATNDRSDFAESVKKEICSGMERIPCERGKHDAVNSSCLTKRRYLNKRGNNLRQSSVFALLKKESVVQDCFNALNYLTSPSFGDGSLEARVQRGVHQLF